MYRIAIKMLVGDAFKFPALVFAVASCAFLISQQVSIFVGLMDRTTSQIKDVGAPIWVMHPSVRYVDELRPLPEGDVDRVRSVAGVAWAVRLIKSTTRASGPDGSFRAAVLMGFDDATLVGAPPRMLVGSVADLSAPDAVIVDDQGFRSLLPGVPLRTGDVVELNERRARIVGVCRSSPPFATLPVIYTRYSSALRFVGRERNAMTFVLAAPAPGYSVEDACRAIAGATALKALPARAFAWDTIRFYIANTGIPVNFGITVAVGIIVGVVIIGQTFLLFVFENIKAFAALKAMGTAGRTLVRMVVLQSAVVGVLGLSIGLGACAVFFWSTADIPKLRNFILHGEVAGGTAALMMLIAVSASLVAVRRLSRIEPAVVFRA